MSLGYMASKSMRKVLILPGHDNGRGRRERGQEQVEEQEVGVVVLVRQEGEEEEEEDEGRRRRRQQLGDHRCWERGEGGECCGRPGRF